MGRSRVITYSADDDPSQRSKRKRATSCIENLETATTLCEGRKERKEALYHCNYCNKDISGKIRIKCATCTDFDLCVECFSVGTEVKPHKSNHPYRVMDNLSFPLICLDWNADEEILLLEGIEMYGIANWNEVGEHVGTKSTLQCIDHYNTTYMNSPCFPLPDMSQVMGKNREELLALAKQRSEMNKVDDIIFNSQFPSPSRIRVDEVSTVATSSLTADTSSGSANTTAMAAKKASTKTIQRKDGGQIGVKVEDQIVGEKKNPGVAGDNRPSLMELSGYNPKRHEFDVEYDNDAEQQLADMDFKESDTDIERELKLRVLHIYSKRLDERKRCKDFIVERGLLQSDGFEKGMTREERELHHRYKVFMRFQSKQEHERLVKSVIEEHRISRRIQELQEARGGGCRTCSEAERFLEQKRKKNEGWVGGVAVKEEDAGGAACHTSWDVSGLPGADLLSEPEKGVCCELKILPCHYLKMLQVMSMEMMTGKLQTKSEAYGLFRVEPTKVDAVYDMLLNKGIVPWSS